MYYSAIGALAILILCIENQEILLKRGRNGDHPAWKMYRAFLFAILAYLLTDVAWGILEQLKLAVALKIDTSLYFVATAVVVLLWTHYVVTYLNESKVYGSLLIHAGHMYFAALIITVVVNVYIPVLFEVDRECVYTALPLRYAVLGIQVLILLLVSAYAFIIMAKRRDAASKRYRTIGFFGLITALFLLAQLWFPYLPLYSVAYLLGTSLLHTFVVNDEKAEYEAKLEEGIRREKQQLEDLRTAWELAYTDALTGVKSKLAFVEAEESKDQAIRAGSAPAFAVAVFDLNGLKWVNDTQGHEQGDRYIADACALICARFQHSPVFRIGGDEFAAILENGDYDKRVELVRGFNEMMDVPKEGNRPVIAIGLAEYLPGVDECFNGVFQRADQQMYKRKAQLKG